MMGRNIENQRMAGIRPCNLVASYTPLGPGPNVPGAPQSHHPSQGIMDSFVHAQRSPTPGGAWGFGPGLLVKHVHFGECEFDTLTALQAHGEARYLARFGVFGKVDNLPVFSTVEAALRGGRRGAYPDPPT